MNKNFICINGNYKIKDEYIFKISNRAFQYGDAIFETMFASHNQVRFFSEHIERLVNSMKILKMKVPERFISNTDSLHREITKLLNKNMFYKGARIRLTVFRNSTGLYTPQSNEIEYVIEANKLDNTKYELNSKGLKIDIYDEILKPKNILSKLKTTNTLLYILAGISKKEKFLDEILLLNTEQNVIETLSSNIFYVNNNIIFTPPINEGCVNGIMRKNIIKIATENNMEISISKITKEDLLNANEIFLTNAISGIKWVSAFRTKRYYNKVSKILIDKLNNAN